MIQSGPVVWMQRLCWPHLSEGGDVEEDHLIGALVIVALAQGHRLAQVAHRPLAFRPLHRPTQIT